MSKTPASAVLALRDLNRQTAKVFEAMRKFGSAEICTRRGEVFTVAPQAASKSGEKRRSRAFPNFEPRWKKLRELGLVPPTQIEDERINRIARVSERVL